MTDPFADFLDDDKTSKDDRASSIKLSDRETKKESSKEPTKESSKESHHKHTRSRISHQPEHGGALLMSKPPITDKDIATINNNILTQTRCGSMNNVLIPVSSLRRGIDKMDLPTTLEYITCKPMNAIATALSLPGGINMKPDIAKIEYTHPTGLTIIIRHAPLDRLSNYVFWYTCTTQYREGLAKLVSKHKHLLNKTGLYGNGDATAQPKYIETKTETVLFKNLSNILGIKFIHEPSQRTLQTILELKQKYKERIAELERKKKALDERNNPPPQEMTIANMLPKKDKDVKEHKESKPHKEHKEDKHDKCKSDKSDKSDKKKSKKHTKD
jgi:hypothetical protein